MEKFWRLYHRVEKALIAVAIAVPLALHYLPFSAEAKNEALPPAVALAFIVVLGLLFSIDKKLDARIGRKEYRAMTDAIPDMIQIVEKKRSGGHSVKVIASTAATTVTTLLPRLEQITHGQHANIDVQIKLIDPHSPLAAMMPSHWAEETASTLKRLEGFRHQNVRITCSQYSYLPCLGGILIDDNHLFLGFYVWEQNQQGASLQGAEQPHFYFQRGASGEYWFRLWESWFNLAPAIAVQQTPPPPASRQPRAALPEAAHTTKKKLIVAHRGIISSTAHENTVAAFEKAIELGADMIEFDVRRTKDGKLIIHHDEKINALEISHSDFHDLSAAASHAGFKLATLEDVLRSTRARIQLDIELKEAGYEAEVLDLLQFLNPSSVRTTSFDPACVKNIKALDRHIRAGLLVEKGSQEEIGRLYSQASADFLAPHYGILDAAAPISDGLFVWGVDDEAAMEASFRHPKVGAIITNHVEAALGLRAVYWPSSSQRQ